MVSLVLILVGLAMFAVLALATRLVDAAQAGKWRCIAVERRERWEARQGLMLHVAHQYDGDSWGED